MGVEVSPILEETARPGQPSAEISAAEHEVGEFVSVGLVDTETIWSDFFEAQVGRE